MFNIQYSTLYRPHASRQRFKSYVLKLRFSVLDVQGNVSILVVVDSGYQSYLVVNENLGNGSVDQELNGDGLFPGEMSWMERPLH